MTVLEITREHHGCGRTRECVVIVPASMASNGCAHHERVPVDHCLAPRVDGLNAAGKHTAACCCGHGKGPGCIILHNGTTIETGWCPQ